jgi:fatty acid desaturase
MSATSPATPDLLKNSQIIRRELMRLSDETYERHPFLARQDLIGGTIFGVSVAAIVAGALGYAYGILPAWAVLISSGFFMGVLHDLEHDLLHRLYFQNKRWLYNTAMLTVWILRPSSINPWIRRDWHMHHHRASGTPSDIEERGLLNGERWGLRRAVMSCEPLLAIVLRPLTIIDMLRKYADAQKPSERLRARIRATTAYFPIGVAHAVAMYWFLGFHFSQFVHQAAGVPWPVSPLNATVMPVLDFVAVTLMLPNAMRTFCLYVVSSNIHYYGDIDPKNIVQQAQVVDRWFLYPLQFFCCDFGRTHLIHHFAVQYPFYMRLWIADAAMPVMRAYGVRFNDFDNMRRANRWHDASAQPAAVSDERDERAVA